MAPKRGTSPGDVVLIHYQGRPATYARLEDVRPHARPGWFFCDLLVLAVPVQAVTWILERSQIDGAEFTMGGQPVRLERLPGVGAVHEKRRAADAESPATSGDAAAKPDRAKPEAGTAPAAPAAARSTARSRAARESNVVRLFPRK
ncbi:MAG TPA: hypothetical protein VFD92_12530 [Candidatus Binatia bacterium]|nr:hypothetical protein [Candidatus Binatia bacterium]